jgi:hypothetical protein
VRRTLGRFPGNGRPLLISASGAYPLRRADRQPAEAPLAPHVEEWGLAAAGPSSAAAGTDLAVALAVSPVAEGAGDLGFPVSYQVDASGVRAPTWLQACECASAGVPCYNTPATIAARKPSVARNAASPMRRW